MKYLIVGLGNIGPEYAFTRHNIGFMILDRMSHLMDYKFSLEKLAYVAETKYKGRTFICIKPTTYMNLSGKAVKYYMEKEKIPKERLLVLVDDIALPYGSLRLRGKGSAAGHNGLKNIQDLTGGQDYARLRFGIGSDFSRGRQVDFVLGSFSKEEQKDLMLHIERSIDIIKSFTTAGLSQTMTNFND